MRMFAKLLEVSGTANCARRLQGVARETVPGAVIESWEDITLQGIPKQRLLVRLIPSRSDVVMVAVGFNPRLACWNIGKRIREDVLHEIAPSMGSKLLPHCRNN
jgi:hypothetical protein